MGLAWFLTQRIGQSFTQDHMKFALERTPRKETEKSFGDLWVGELPEEAQDLVDLLVSSYEHPDVVIPHGFVHLLLASN